MSSIYYERLLKEIEFNPTYDVALFDPLPGEIGKKILKPLIESDNDGNVLYNISNIHGVIFSVDISDARSKQKYVPIQLRRFANPGDGPKYLPVHPGQGVFPWISKEIIDAFKERKKVKRLIITEGYKKAFVACKKGLFCIGIPGITVWKDKNSKDIFSDIRLFCEVCQVEDILWLTDADTLSINWEPNKELYKRPNLFCTSVNLFKMLCRDWCNNLFYAHIHEDSTDKGIDDLLINNPSATKKIVKELNGSSGECKYIRRFNISSMHSSKIQEIFGIHKSVNEFYEKYGKFIGLEEFIYRNSVYYFDVDKTELVFSQSGESAQFIRVVKNYYMLASMVTRGNVVKRTLIAYDENSIKAKFKDYDKNKLSRIIYEIPFYDGFYNEPNNIDYQKEIAYTDEAGHTTKWFNRYMKLTHRVYTGIVKEEDIPLSLKFIKHIFGDKTISYKGRNIFEYELGLDYMQLLYVQPKQALPILSLVSEANQTGKSKFSDWCIAIFQLNAKRIPPDMLTGSFTEYFLNCLLVVIDEALFNKQEVMERVKSLTTSPDGVVNGKNDKEIETQTYLKIQLSSNNVNDFAILKKEDERFWVREVPKIKEEDYVIDFFDKLCAEIPKFLKYLIDRKMATDKDDDRMYFSLWVRHTSALDRVIKGSKPSNERLIESAIRRYMFDAKKFKVHLGQKNIRDLCDEKSLDLKTIRWIVEDKMKKKPLPYSRWYEFYDIQFDYDKSETLVKIENHKTEYYTFYLTDFYEQDDIIDLFSVAELAEQESQQLLPEEFKTKVTAEAIYRRYGRLSKVAPCSLSDYESIYTRCSTFKEFDNELHNFIVSSPSSKSIINLSNEDIPPF